MNATIDPANSALVIIDMQRDFCAPGGYADHAGLDVRRLRAPIPAIQHLLDTARHAGMLVVFTREGHLPDLSDCPPAKLTRSAMAGARIGSIGPLGRLLIRGEYGQDLIPECEPWPGEITIDKPGYSAFEQTGLDELLHWYGISQLLLCGVTTEVCVHSTLRGAIDRGYQCLTVADACAGNDPVLHEAALRMISLEGGIFGDVGSSEDVVKLICRRSAV